MIDKPTYYYKKGNGILSSETNELEVDFEVFLISGEIVIYCTPIDGSPYSFINEGYLALKGLTEENRKIQVTELLVPLITDELIELTPNRFVLIGEYFDSFYDKITYPIANLFNLNLKFTINGFNVKIQSEKGRMHERVSKYWKISQVGCSIELLKKNGQKKDYNRTINTLQLLLSLATGRNISFCIEHQSYNEKNLTVIGNRFSSGCYIRDIIPQNNLTNFIIEGMEVTKDWDDDDFLDFKIVIESINGTDTGYLDERIFHIMQSWEIVAVKWGGNPRKLPTELWYLKKELKKTLKIWHNNYPDYDGDNFWDNRVLGSLQWHRNIKKLEGTLEKFKLDNKKLQINFEGLIKDRNSVTHKGKLNNGKPIRELIKAQFGLRLLLLRLLRYNKEILDYRMNDSGYIESADINSFLTSK